MLGLTPCILVQFGNDSDYIVVVKNTSLPVGILCVYFSVICTCDVVVDISCYRHQGYAVIIRAGATDSYNIINGFNLLQQWRISIYV